MKSKLLLFGIIAVLLSASGAGVMAAFNQKLTLELCADLYAVQDRIYGIDYQAEKQVYQIYRCGIDGQNTVSISQDAEKNNNRYVYDKIMYDKVSNMTYVHVSEFACDTGLLEKETVFYCDFEKQKLKSMWEIGSDTNNRTSAAAMTCSVRNGILYYLTDDYENGYCIYRQDKNEKTAIRTIDSPGDTIFSKYQFNEDGMLYAFSTTGGLYLENNDGFLAAVFGNSNAWDSYVNPSFGNSEAACLNVKNQRELYYSQENNSITENDMIRSYNQTRIAGENDIACSIDNDMLTNHCLLPDGGFAAYSELPELIRKNNSRLQSGLAVFNNNTMVLYPYLSYNTKYIYEYFFKWMFGFLGISVILIIAGFIIYAFFIRKQYISIWLETTIFAAAVFGTAIGFTSFIINQIMTESFNDSYQKVFDNLEQEICCELDSLIMQTDNFSKEIFFSKDFHEKLSEIMQNTSIKNPKTGKEEFAPYFVFHGMNSENQLIVLYNSSGREHIPTSYTYDNSYLNQEYKTVLEEHINQNLTQYDTEGTWNVQLCPYENTQYEINAVVEIGIDQYLTDWKTKNITSGIVWFIVAFCMLIVVLVVVFLGIFFFPIRRLGIQIEQGNVEKPGKFRHSIEITAIWERLYVMISNINHRQNELELNNRQHYRFISAELVKLLGLNELADAKAGISRKCNLHIVYAEISANNIEQINSAYGELLLYADQYEGIVCEMDTKHILWLFKGEFEKALTSAEGIITIAFQKGIKCGVGIGSDIITVFVRGTDKCADIAAYGKEVELSGKIAKISMENNKYMLTESAEKLLLKKR